MKTGRFAFVAVLAALSSLPAAAQTTQMTPGKPSTSVPAASPVKKAPPAPSAAPAAVSQPISSLVDINSASSEDLDKLPGIGRSRADAIIKNRPYSGKDDLLNRKIIPSNVYNGVKDKIIAKQG